MFTINGERWYVKFVSPLDQVLVMGDGSYTIGTCDDLTKTIYLADNLKGSLLKRVLCHEIVHSAMFSYDVDLTYEQEELLADLIATYGQEIINITNKIFKKLRY